MLARRFGNVGRQERSAVATEKNLYQGDAQATEFKLRACNLPYTSCGSFAHELFTFTEEH